MLFRSSLENRNNLRPVDVPALAKLLCTQLGLNLSLSTRIAMAWSNALAMGTNQPWQGSLAHQHQLIDKIFARELHPLLRELRPEAGSASLPIPASDADVLLAWCAQNDADQIDSDAGSDNTSDRSGGLKRRRDVNDRNDQERPQQRPRND